MSQLEMNKPKLNLRVIKRKGREIAGHAIFSVPWVSLLTMAVVSAISTICLGLLIIILPLFIAHLSAPSGDFLDVLNFGIEFWLAAHGGTYYLQGLPLSLTPTGISLVIIAILVIATLVTARQAAEQKLNKNPWVIVQITAIIQALLYYLAVLGIAILYSSQSNWGRFSIGLAVISLSGTAIGAILGVKPKLPKMITIVIKSIIAGQITLLCGATILLFSSVLLASEQMAILENKSGVTVLGSVLLGIIYLAYFPTLLIWGEAYLLGGGIQIGMESFLAPGASHGAVLPGIPIFAVVTDSTNPWNWLWVIIGISSGVVVVFTTLKNNKIYRSYIQLFWGGVSLSLFIALSFALFCFSTGSLGTGRMAFVGPRIFEIAIIGVFGLVLVGLLTTLIFAYFVPPKIPEATIENQNRTEDKSVSDSQILWRSKDSQGRDKYSSHLVAEESTVMMLDCQEATEILSMAVETSNKPTKVDSDEDTAVLVESEPAFYSKRKKIVDLTEDSLE